MPKIKRRVTTYMIRYTCDKCGDGEMVWDGLGEKDIPGPRPVRIHYCDGCGEVAALDRVYPYEEEEENKEEEKHEEEEKAVDRLPN